MLAKRIIPCLDVKDGRVVKGLNFVNLRDVGDPVEAAKFYNESGADELVFLDITATHEQRKTVIDVVERTAKEVFIPLTVGGGISSVETMHDLLRAGADKISINSAAIRDPSLVARAADRFGSQCVVVAIDTKTLPDGSRHVVINGGRIDTGVDAIEWAKKVEELGAGEPRLDPHRHNPVCRSYYCGGGDGPSRSRLLAGSLAEVPEAARVTCILQ